MFIIFNNFLFIQLKWNLYLVFWCILHNIIHKKTINMKIKNLLASDHAIIFTSGLFAQEKFAPDEIITGTYLGKTAPLRDMPVINPADYAKVK